MNNKGQFSIIAALLVAVILISSVMITYATIRYSSNQQQPQILSAIDETNLALKQVLGFTVGYYGSILKVTGNSSYARTLASNYLHSGLENIANIRPEWGASFSVTDLELRTNWFMNESYSKGTLNVTYALTGLGISGVAYSASSRLDVNIFPSPSSSQILLNVTKDDEQPLNDLGLQNFKFYRYRYTNLTWESVNPSSEPVAFSNGTYLIDIPSGINPYSYAIQVDDTRGLNVAASSFSHYKGTFAFNSTFGEAAYVDNDNSNVDSQSNIGTHSNFAEQQSPPNSAYDTLTKDNSSISTQDFYPDSYSPLGLTSLVSGSLSDVQSDNGNYMTFNSYSSEFFGYPTKGGSTSTLSSVRGSRFTTSWGGPVYSISAYLKFTSSSSSFGNSATGSSGHSILNTIRGQRFASPSSVVVAQSIRAYIYCTSSAKNMKAAIYDSSGNLVAETDQSLIPASSSAAWRTFNFASPPTLTASTNYNVVVWSQSGSGSADLRYSSSSGGNGRSKGQTYGSWPSSVSFSTNSNRYSIYLNYLTTFRAKAAIYSSNGGSLIASTDEKTLTTVDNWVTFTFSSLPTLTASSSYVLALTGSDTSNVNMYYNTGTAEYFRASQAYPNWPSSLSDQGTQRTFSIYCAFNASEYTSEVEFSGASNTNSWSNLLWALNTASTSAGVNATFQLYNYQTAQYPTSGSGYMTSTLGTSDNTTEQAITANPTNFRDDIGRWKLKFTAVKTASSPFDVKIDLARFRTGITYYALDLEEQWVNTSSITPRPVLAIKTGALSSENLAVDAWHAGSWHTVSSALVSGWNNISVSAYMDPTFTIRFRADSSTLQSNWQIDAVLLRPESDQELFLSLQNTVATVEILQNGTMQWLGQNLQLTAQELPIPPVPAKAIHVNQTIDGVNQEVPFQIEDWGSGYTVPLGLTNNATVFGNRQMIVFLTNTHVSDFTVWWNGSDEATQTPLAFTNQYFTADNPSGSVLSNGQLILSFGSGFTVTSTVGGTSSSATFMRINNEDSVYGSSLAYVIHHGVVRDVVQQEAEWGTSGSGGGADGSPNLYANIVLTLPANATYFTYQLRIMFINSAQSRTITDLCPINLSSSVGQLQTENGTILSDPIVASGTQIFNSTGTWIHHWSQFTDGTNGAGIMFTDSANQMLYAFDGFAPQTVRGALKADSASQTIELLPVTLNSVSFQTPLDINWSGAVVTFDGTTQIYAGSGQPGLWIFAELPPTISVTTNS